MSQCCLSHVEGKDHRHFTNFSRERTDVLRISPISSEWPRKGLSKTTALLRPKLKEQLARHQFGLIILDPAYKVLGSRDENA